MPALVTATLEADTRREADALDAHLQAGLADGLERIARDQYGLVEPGEQALSILPAPGVGALPGTWPFTVVEQILAERTGTAGS